MLKKIKAAGLSVLALALAFAGTPAFAANTPNLTQTINAGSFSFDILDGSRVPVGSPSFAMSASTFSFDCQYVGAGASTGSLGSASQRLYVSNPGVTANWSVAIAATAGATATWTGGTTLDFNDATGTNPGCSDGGDADGVAGQLGISPQAGTITNDCTSCSGTNVSKGSNTAFAQGSVDSITLMSAASGETVWRGYLTGVGLTQTIPAETAPASYTLNMTITGTAS